MLELKNVSKYYNTSNIVTVGLKKINLKLQKNEIVAITGESGSGKSTLLNVICGVDTYEDGEMYFKGEETSYFNQDDMDEYRKKHVAFIYQSYNIIDSYTTIENVMVPLLLKGYTKKEAHSRALELLKKVGLEKRIYTKGIKLSGGEKQRCVIARALATDCEILACDEPTGNLDSETGKQIIELIHEVSKDKLVLIVTHNYDEIKDIVTRNIKIHDGEVIEDKAFSSPEPSSKEENNLINNSSIKKNLFHIGLLNIKNTPKKAFLCSIVFSFFWIMYLFFILSSIAWYDNNHYTRNPNYVNSFQDRIVVYNKDFSALNVYDFNEIDGDVFFNSIYEDYKYKTHFTYQLNTGFFGLNYKKSDVFNAVFTNHIPNDIEHHYGNLIENDTDLYILFPIDKLEKYSNQMISYIGGDLNFNQYNINLPLKLCGYGTCDDIEEIIYITKYNLDNHLNHAYMDNLTLYIDGNIISSYDYDDSLDKITIHYTGPSYPNVESITVNFNELYNCDYNEFDIIYHESSIISTFAYIPQNLTMSKEYVASIYTNKTEKAIEYFNDLGYSVVQPGRYGIDYESKDNMYCLVYIAACVVTTIVLFFISYLVISRIYSSRGKEYTILRSNGIMKKNMSFIVKLEILILGMSFSIIIFGISHLLYFVPDSIFRVVKYNNIGLSLLYFLSAFIFSYLIAGKINKRIFKYSIATSIRNGGVRND